MSLDEDLARGHTAKQLAENPLFQEMFDTIDLEIAEQWKNSKSEDVEGRERLYLKKKLLEEMQQLMTVWIQRGTTAEFTLSEQSRQDRRAIGSVPPPMSMP